MKIFKEKRELPVFVVAILIFLSSLGFLAFAVYYIVFLPVPMAMQPLKVRILTNIQLEEIKEGAGLVQEEIDFSVEEEDIIDEENEDSSEEQEQI